MEQENDLNLRGTEKSKEALESEIKVLEKKRDEIRLKIQQGAEELTKLKNDSSILKNGNIFTKPKRKIFNLKKTETPKNDNQEEINKKEKIIDDLTKEYNEIIKTIIDKELLMRFLKTSSDSNTSKEKNQNRAIGFEKEPELLKTKETIIPEVVEEKETEKESSEKNGVTTETLAEIYAQQGAYPDAIKIYKKLKEKNPEKEEYYNKKITELKNKPGVSPKKEEEIESEDEEVKKTIIPEVVKEEKSKPEPTEIKLKSEEESKTNGFLYSHIEKTFKEKTDPEEKNTETGFIILPKEKTEEEPAQTLKKKIEGKMPKFIGVGGGGNGSLTRKEEFSPEEIIVNNLAIGQKISYEGNLMPGKGIYILRGIINKENGEIYFLENKDDYKKTFKLSREQLREVFKSGKAFLVKDVEEKTKEKTPVIKEEKEIKTGQTVEEGWAEKDEKTLNYLLKEIENIKNELVKINEEEKAETQKEEIIPKDENKTFKTEENSEKNQKIKDIEKIEENEKGEEMKNLATRKAEMGEEVLKIVKNYLKDQDYNTEIDVDYALQKTCPS